MAGYDRSLYQTYLSSIPMFRSCTTEQLDRLAELGTAVSMTDAPIVSEGDRGDDFYVITSGKGRVMRGGREVAELGPGDYFGELSLFDPAPGTRPSRRSAPCHWSPSHAIRSSRRSTRCRRFVTRSCTEWRTGSTSSTPAPEASRPAPGNGPAGRAGGPQGPWIECRHSLNGGRRSSARASFRGREHVDADALPAAITPARMHGAVLADAGESRTEAELFDLATWSSYDQFRRLVEATAANCGTAALTSASSGGLTDPSMPEMTAMLQSLGSPEALFRTVSDSGGSGIAPVLAFEGIEVGPSEWIVRERFSMVSCRTASTAPGRPASTPTSRTCSACAPR